MASELTGYTGPENPLPMRLRSTVCPILPTWSEAPITATELGLSTRARLRASAAASREFRTLVSASDGSIANSRWRVDPSNEREISYPARRNTWIIDRFSESTSASKWSIPHSAAAPARCSRKIDPSPRP